jgi:hypothetical protein
MSRKNIANDDKTSYYEGIFGKGEEAKMYFAFSLIPKLLFLMCGAILVSFAISYVLKIDFLSLLGVVVPIFSAPLTFMIGYLFGDKRKEAI